MSDLQRSLTMITCGLLLVLLVRTPARRLFGAGPAFTLWLLVPLAAALPWLPAVVPSAALVRVMTSLAIVRVQPEQIVPHAPQIAWLQGAWLIGVAWFVLRLVIHYSRLRMDCRPLPTLLRNALPALPGLLPDALRCHVAGPAVLWAPRPLLLLPPDFHQRFDAGQRELILRHELSHLQRGDTLWNLLAEIARALLWFHPLAWLALSRFRLDQELACDEHALRALPGAESRYARTLLHSTGMHVVPVLIPWLAQPQLKERLIMIKQARPTPLRRRSGFIALAALMLGSVTLAQAAHQAKSSVMDTPASQDLSYNANVQPHYPADAVKNKEHGMVMLLVRVGADGKPLAVKVQPDATTASASLVKSASDAAMQWRFSAAMRNGKPVVGYVRVPIRYDLTMLPETTKDVPANASTKS